jgi:hypothetical protein
MLDDALEAVGVLAAEAGALEVEAGVLAVEAGVVEVEAVDDGLDEHPAISAATATAAPPATMRARRGLDIRAAANAAAHDPSTLAIRSAPLQSRTVT